MAADAQSSLHVEIQTLRDALSASEKKADRYALMVAKLTVELDDLRDSICHSCKEKLASSKNSVPPIRTPAGHGSTSTAASVSAPLWRRVFRGGRQRSRPKVDNAPSIRPFDSPEAPNKPLLVPSEHNFSPSQTTATLTRSRPNEDEISPKQGHKPSQWSVVYHPEVERTLDFQLAHAFAHDSPVICVKMSPDGQRLAVGGTKNTYLYELKTGSKCSVFVDRYVKDYINITRVQFSPNGQLLATGASDCQIRIWDIARKRMQVMLKGHESEVNSIIFSPNGRSLVSASIDCSVRIWNIRDGSSKVLPVTGAPEFFMFVAFSPDGRHIAAGNSDNSLWIWDSQTHRLVARWRGHTDCVWCTAFTPDGNGFMSGGRDCMVKYWDVSSLGKRQGVTTDTMVNEDGFPEVRSFLGHSGPIHSIALFPDKTQWIVTGSDDRSVRVWDIESGVCQLTLQGHKNWVREVAVSRTQNLLATASGDGYVTVWNYRVLQASFHSESYT